MALVIIFRLYATAGREYPAPPRAVETAKARGSSRTTAPAERGSAALKQAADRRLAQRWTQRGRAVGGEGGISQRRWSRWFVEQLDNEIVRQRSNIESSPLVQWLLGGLEMARQRPTPAVVHFDKCLKHRPAFAPALAGKASALTMLKRYAEAGEAYRTLLEHHPQEAAARYNYGVLLYRQADFSAAAGQFRELVRQQPHHARGQYNLATLAQRDGRITEARQAWQAFTQLEPQVPSAWFNLGIVQMDFDAPEEAASCFHRCVEMARDDAAGWLNLALAQAAIGRTYTALTMAETAERLSPGDPAVLRVLATLHRRAASQGSAVADAHLAEARRLEELVEPRHEEPVPSSSPASP